MSSCKETGRATVTLSDIKTLRYRTCAGGDTPLTSCKSCSGPN